MRNRTRFGGSAFLLPVLLLSQAGALAHPQSATGAAVPITDIAGTWQGTLQTPGRPFRIVLKIAKAPNGAWTALNYSIDQNGEPMQTAGVSLQGSTFRYSIPSLGGSYEGRLSPDGNSITGKWAGNYALDFQRATVQNAWTIPEPPPARTPMTATDPSFEVATIKPSDPGKPGKYFRVVGRTWFAHDASLAELLQVAYGLHPKQIVGGPPWLRTEKFDLTGTPDAPGEPNGRQWLLMLQKVLAERFGLVTHREKQELSTYVLSLAAGGPKNLVPNDSGNPLPGLEFRPVAGGLLLPARNATMAQFSQMMQQVALDRPVVDHTGLTGKFDFQLRFLPDESQFNGQPPATLDAAGSESAPNLAQALQQQLGLRLTTEKIPTDVLVIDKVHEPTSN